MTERRRPVLVRPSRREDFEAIQRLSLAVYPESPPWSEQQLTSHLVVFSEGQLVAVDSHTDSLLGMAASLIVLWDDYEIDANWRDMTDHGMFTNHDPEYGRTLYGAEVMVDPRMQGRGIGKKIYAARRELTERRGLLRIRAGARLRGYHRYADRMDPREYVLGVVRGQLGDPTLSFQVKQGFRVLAVVEDYLHHDPESLGHAAVIEWLNPQVAGPADNAAHDQRYLR